MLQRIPDDMKSRCSKILYSASFSEERYQKLHGMLMPSIKGLDVNHALVFAGSLGRKEAHDTSDVDAFVLIERKAGRKEQATAQALIAQLRKLVKLGEINLRLASAGAFTNVCSLEDLVRNIGGKRETNDILTQRMVLLVEGRGISVMPFSGKQKGKS